ncbi:MAG: class I SAM-dependent methyltransferase [Microscillaceae bacterium]|jgi:ubiquinone/menaquinone biosynthesis C-methylase UbiE|nr:class I SAM-dependent methyltransferase [Microscillaceae bacterium]
MNTLEDKAQKSHIAHEQHMNNLIGEKDKRFFVLRNQDCVAYWLNARTLGVLKPLWAKQNTWLTIGDYNGFEAKFFGEQNQDVMASDISEAFLKEAKNEGLIAQYRKENVEQLSFADSSFDYVSCREAFHHFPRAYLGAYEMIRVARQAAILIEPVDVLSKIPLLLWLKNICDLFNPLLINKIWKNRFSWEIVGNYVFKLSEREVEKMAMGIGLPCIAFKEMNVILNIKENVNEVPTNQKLLRKIKRRLAILNFLSACRLIPYNTLVAIVFKAKPEADLLVNLKKEGYKILELPPNPYLK